MAQGVGPAVIVPTPPDDASENEIAGPEWFMHANQKRHQFMRAAMVRIDREAIAGIGGRDREVTIKAFELVEVELVDATLEVGDDIPPSLSVP